MDPTTAVNETPVRYTGRRIVITTFGSLGDLHPCVALALELKARGHTVVIATSEFYRQKIETLGIGFRSVRPDLPDGNANPELMRRIMDVHDGPECVIREIVLPALQGSYEDTLAAAERADLLISHTLTFATSLVAEKKGLPWASLMLQPLGFFSAYDPPLLPIGRFLARLRFLGPTFYRILFGLARWRVGSWLEPLRQLRYDIQLPPTSRNALFEGQHSPSLVLAMFSKQLADKQRDWPPQTLVTGFPFYDQDGGEEMSPELTRFLDAGPAPIVFTLGSAAVFDAGSFYEHSAAAAKLLGRRAVLVVGKIAGNRPASLPDGVVAFDYVPFSEVFSRAAAIVHQGGIGTTGQAMRSGRPMLVMPYSHDQPDNAARIKRLGIGRTISRTKYNPTRAAAELKKLLDNPIYSKRAAEIGERVRKEDGIRTACDALENLIASAIRPNER